MATPVRYRNGIIGTTLFHGVLLLFLLLMGYQSIFPPPAEKGILVDFGNSDEGTGAYEPRYSEPAATQPNPAEASVASDEEAIMTQNHETAPIVRSEPVASRPRPAATPARSTPAPTPPAPQTAPERTVDSRALFPGRGALQSDATSEGIAGGTGNQGVSTGAPDAKVYGPGGDVGGGNSFELTGRTLIGSLPRPNYPGQYEGVVVIEITVDGNGVVTDARYTARGSTTLEERLVSEARAAALKARFSRKPDSPVQKGTIKYTFRLE